MTRTETIGPATLILGDARDVLPLVRADVILTDPVWPNCPANSVPGWDRPWQLWAEACGLFPPVKRVLTVLRCDSDPRFLQHLPSLPFFRVVALPYVMPGYLGRALGGDEYAYWFGTPIASAPNRRVVPGRAPAAQPAARPANGHPMSRAQVHFDWLVPWCTDPDESVLDPFMGSGTTLAAAVKSGRRCMGIEVEPRFYEIALRRVEAAQRQADLFTSGADLQETRGRRHDLFGVGA